jgi:hypothetical protein
MRATAASVSVLAAGERGSAGPSVTFSVDQPNMTLSRTLVNAQSVVYDSFRLGVTENGVCSVRGRDC